MSRRNAKTREQLLLLLCALACLQLCASDRVLKAPVLDCSSIHPQCSSCAVKRTSLDGLTTFSTLQCKSCSSPRYVLLSNATSSTCGCAPGFYTQPGAPTTCVGCPKNSFCPGGLGAQAAHSPCGSCLMTVTTLAKNASACITEPGCGYKPDGSAAPCKRGIFSSGNHKQPCTPCPSGLTTGSDRAESVSACMAPAGFFFQNNQALPCPKGSYKPGINRASSCSSCPAGLTTNSTAAVAQSACNLAEPGYMPMLNNTVLTVVPCPVGTYGPDGAQCVNCTDGLTTQAAASTAPFDCTAPPGYGYYQDGAGDDNPVTTAELQAAQQNVMRCPPGSWKAGWSLDPCKSCGTNIPTDTSDTNGLGISPDQCVLPAGWGSVFDKQKRLVATRCSNGSYGMADSTYGLEAHPCQPCPPHTVTPDQATLPDIPVQETPLLTSSDQCTTRPGFGWEDGTAVPCPIGYWASGYDNSACTKCGVGLTTGSTQSTRPTDCIALPGWQKKNPGDSYGEACPVGSYSQGGGDSCHKCPLGSSTQYASSFAASQCSLCRPGWGFDNRTSTCVICGPGFYSTGGSDEPCMACAPGQTSTVAGTSSGDCFDLWLSTSPDDSIETPASALTTLSVGASSNASADAARCKDACQAEELCEYWVFKAAQASSSQDGCFLKLAPTSPAADTYTSIKLATGDYAVWPAGADEYGQRASEAAPWSPPDGSTVDPWNCLRGCDKDSTCLAVFTTKLNETWACWMIPGSSSLGYNAGSIKVAPTQINSYLWAWTTVATNSPGANTAHNQAPVNTLGRNRPATRPALPMPSMPADPVQPSPPVSPSPASPSPAVAAPEPSPSPEPATTNTGYFPTRGVPVRDSRAPELTPTTDAPAPTQEAQPSPAPSGSNSTAPAGFGNSSPTPRSPSPEAPINAPTNNATIPPANQPQPSPEVPANAPTNNATTPPANQPQPSPEVPTNAPTNNATIPPANQPQPSPEVPAKAPTNNATTTPPANQPQPSPEVPTNNATTTPPANQPQPSPEVPTNNATTTPPANQPQPSPEVPINAPTNNATIPPANQPQPSPEAPAKAPTNNATTAPPANQPQPSPEVPTNNASTTPPANQPQPSPEAPANVPTNNATTPPANQPQPSPEVPTNAPTNNTTIPPANQTQPSPEAPTNAPTNNTTTTPPANQPQPSSEAPTDAPNNNATNQTPPAAPCCQVNAPALQLPPTVSPSPAVTGVTPSTSNSGAVLIPTNSIASTSPAPGLSPLAASPSPMPVNGCVPDHISTVAGYGQQAFIGDGAPATSAGLLYPTGVALDRNGSLFIADSGQHRIRRVDADTGLITTVAGVGSAGSNGDGGPAVAAQINTPTSVTFDGNGSMFITEALGNRVRRVDAQTGIITTVAGTGRPGFGGDSGDATSALLKNPVHTTFDAAGNLYISDFGNFRVRRLHIATGVITTFAGVGTAGYSGDGGPASLAELNNPSNLLFDPQGNLLVADSLSHAIRKISTDGTISTIAGTAGKYGFVDKMPASAAKLWSPMGIALDRFGNLFISDYNNRIRRVDAQTGNITTVAGAATGGFGGDNGPAVDALLSNPQGLVVDPADGSVLFSDYNNHRVRKLSCSTSAWFDS